MHGKRFALTAALALAAPSLGVAGASSSHLGGYCTVVGTPIHLGTYNPFQNAPLLATITLRFTCYGTGSSSVPASFTVYDPGSSGSTFYMADEHAHKLAYELCFDPNCSHPVGTGLGNLNGAVQPGYKTDPSGALQGALLVYVATLPHQNVPAGRYWDHLILDVDY